MSKKLINAGEKLVEAIEADCPVLQAEAVANWRASLPRTTKKKDDTLATVLAKELLVAVGAKVSTPKSSAPAIISLLRRGVQEQVIRDAIVWLRDVNPKREYPLSVYSGKSFKEKFDRILQHIEKQPKPKYY